MGRLMGLILFLVALQATLIIFEGLTPETTVIWDLVTQPFNFESLWLIVKILAIAGTLFGAAVIIGSIIGIKTDFMVLAVFVASLISFGAVIPQFSGVIGKYACNLFCSEIDVAAEPWYHCSPALFIVIITAGALLLYYVFAVLDWWRGKD